MLTLLRAFITTTDNGQGPARLQIAIGIGRTGVVKQRRFIHRPRRLHQLTHASAWSLFDLTRTAAFFVAIDLPHRDPTSVSPNAKARCAFGLIATLCVSKIDTTFPTSASLLMNCGGLFRLATDWPRKVDGDQTNVDRNLASIGLDDDFSCLITPKGRWNLGWSNSRKTSLSSR